jgi:hypothetical protein
MAPGSMLTGHHAVNASREGRASELLNVGQGYARTCASIAVRSKTFSLLPYCRSADSAACSTHKVRWLFCCCLAKCRAHCAPWPLAAGGADLTEFTTLPDAAWGRLRARIGSGTAFGED